VLDLGIGTGLLWSTVDSVQAPAMVVGADSSSGMLERARARQNPLLRLIRADFAHLPFAIATFDLVLLSFSARHSPKLTSMLGQAASRLVRGGRVVLMEYSGETQLTLAGAVMRCYSLIGEATEGPADVVASYFSACPDDVLVDAAAAAGLQIRKLDYIRIVEAEGCDSVVDFVMQSPPVAFDLVRYGPTTRDMVRERLSEDFWDGVLPNQITSKILVCTMDCQNEN
jgi:Methyltransferase domain